MIHKISISNKETSAVCPVCDEIIDEKTPLIPPTRIEPDEIRITNDHLYFKCPHCLSCLDITIVFDRDMGKTTSIKNDFLRIL